MAGIKRTITLRDCKLVINTGVLADPLDPVDAVYLEVPGLENLDGIMEYVEVDTSSIGSKADRKEYTAYAVAVAGTMKIFVGDVAQTHIQTKSLAALNDPLSGPVMCEWIKVIPPNVGATEIEMLANIKNNNITGVKGGKNDISMSDLEMTLNTEAPDPTFSLTV